MAEMLGYTVDEMLGRHIYMFMDAGGIDACKQGIEHSKRGITELHEVEYRKKNGERVYTKTRTSPITDDNGNYTGTLIAVSDITAIRNTAENLAESEEKYSKLLKSIEDMLLSFDANRTITYVGNKVARILEFDTKDITGKKLSEYVHPEDLPVFEALFMESPKVGGESYDFRLRDKQGGIHYMRGISGVYVENRGGQDTVYAAHRYNR